MTTHAPALAASLMLLAVASSGDALAATKPLVTKPAATCTPIVRDAWIRLPPGAMPMAAAYARIENPCAASVAVAGARSDAFGDVSLHETRVEQGVSRMREVPRLPVAPKASVEMRPGGLHLMLMQPAAPLAAGQRLPIELVLEDGRRVRGEFEVRPAAAR